MRRLLLAGATRTTDMINFIQRLSVYIQSEAPIHAAPGRITRRCTRSVLIQGKKIVIAWVQLQLVGIYASYNQCEMQHAVFFARSTRTRQRINVDVLFTRSE